MTAMKRVPGLSEWSRRDFCAAVGVGVAVAACSEQARLPVGTGGLDGTGDNPGGPDASHGGAPVDASPDAHVGSGSGSAHPSPDAAVPSPDAAPAATCGSGASDTGLAPAGFSLGTPKYVTSGRYFVVKDSGGFYALTSLCTHEGAVCVVDSGVFYCPRHGAQFDFDGAVISGPVSRALVHYAMCTLANGHLGVTTSQTVSASTRLVI